MGALQQTEHEHHCLCTTNLPMLQDIGIGLWLFLHLTAGCSGGLLLPMLGFQGSTSAL